VISSKDSCSLLNARGPFGLTPSHCGYFSEEPCTQGVYMWIIKSVPKEFSSLVIEKDVTLILLDTEGLGSYSKSKTYDVKIFTLAVLLSSLFIYNSMGTIDEGALDRLSLVAELSNSIKIQSADATNESQVLSRFFPKVSSVSHYKVSICRKLRDTVEVFLYPLDNQYHYLHRRHFYVYFNFNFIVFSLFGWCEILDLNWNLKETPSQAMNTWRVF
jgi:hypothetical protein